MSHSRAILSASVSRSTTTWGCGRIVGECFMNVSYSLEQRRQVTRAGFCSASYTGVSLLTRV
ncbi:hypothetical protein CJ240_05360 [Varibaculum cambriense]|uniref:Uncharacterized protein n=1 Tax=Varibaculum cambriense TaxID=184870 RepID=A0ABX4US92_9ACTO|nr:hypothetical protein CJ240_05360 [Varibaculum cambriense]